LSRNQGESSQLIGVAIKDDVVGYTSLFVNFPFCSEFLSRSVFPKSSSSVPGEEFYDDTGLIPSCQIT